jgi:tetratricopeptide (TPR) repeat protein
VAVLRLTPEGPELPGEFTLGTLGDLKNLYGQEVAMIGYPGTDTAGFPNPGENAIATFHDGVVSRITDYRYSTNAPWGELQYVQYTMASWGGFSGSPVFLPNGRVVALHNSSRTIPHKTTGEVRSIAHGVRLDALWELLVHHKLLDKTDSKIDPGQVSLERYLKPDPKAEKLRQDFSQAVALVAEAERLIFVNQTYDRGVEKCSQALNLMPDYARGYYVRAIGYVNNWFDNRRRMNRKHALGLLFNAEDDANKYVKLAPSDPFGVILVCLVLNNLGSFTGDRDANRKALDILEKFVKAENLTNYMRAKAHSSMGVAYDNLGDKRKALEEHNEAIRLAPDDAVIYEARADFWHYRGRRDLERADKAKARELRQKQQSP